MTSAIDVALVLVDGDARREIVASLTENATVGQLAGALGIDATLFRHELALDRDASLVEAGVLSGDELGVGAPVPIDWRQLRPELRVIGGAGAGTRCRVDGPGLVVGRGVHADVVLPNPRVSREHARVSLDATGFTVQDLDSRNGVEVDGVRINPNVAVHAPLGSVLRVGDSLLTVVSTGEGATSLRRADAFHLAFDGGRLPLSPAHPVPPAPPAPELPVYRRSSVPFVVPGAGALALAASASGAPAALAFAATPVALLGAFVVERGLHARDARRATAAADAEAATSLSTYRAALLEFAQHARAAAPGPAALLALITHRGPRLWSMSASDASLRLGVVADDDSWVPLTVALRDEPLVLAGAEPTLDAVLSWLVVQAAALISPRELDIVVVSDNVGRWAWTAWLPHRSTASVVPADTTPNEMPVRRARRRLVVLDQPTSARWRSDPALSVDDFVIWRTAHEQDVPFRASTVVSAARPSYARVESPDGVRDDVLIDALVDPDEYGGRAARGLARLRSPFGAVVAAGPTPLTDVVPHLLSAEAVLLQWRRHAGPLRAAIGSDDLGLLELVLDGQNSHVLIAGTTGSGKTRLLESLVVSLAASRSPADLNVLIIDFKGGNELAPLAALPHCVGLVSDRNVAEVDRAISALTREIARRDDVFAEVGASDLDDYVAKTALPLPRLVVIADEFGQFRRDDTLGARVATLLRIAAQGRSKGIHLVLATQSPSTDVTAEIRQNVGVRVCLRVAEPAESVAVLGVTDATRLPGPGHVLISCDNEVRAGRVATVSTTVGEPAPVRVVDLVDSARGAPTGVADAGQRLLDVAVANLRAAADLVGSVAPVLLRPPLPMEIARRDIRLARRPWTTGGLVIGERDRPGIAEPAPFAFDLARDVALTVVGGPRSGRTTTLLSLAEAARDQSNADVPLVVHAIAWAPGLEAIENASGDAGVVRRGDFDHLRRTITWLERDQADGITRLVLIDRLDLLLRDLRDVDGGGLAARLVEVLNDGPRRRIATAATVEPAVLLSGPGALSGPRLVLPVDDPTLAVAVGVPCRADAPPGRGVLGNGDDVHIGLPGSPASTGAVVAGRIARMPDAVSLATLVGSKDERVALGIGGTDRLEPLVVDLDTVGPIVVVVGRAGSGRSQALRTFVASYRGARRVVDAPDTMPDDPSLIVIDDAVRAATTSTWLDSDDFPDQLRRRGHVAVVAYDQADLTALGYRHWLAKRTYPGLLLSLDATPDRIVAGERFGFLPPPELRAGPAGRGWWCWRGTGVPVQVAVF